MQRWNFVSGAAVGLMVAAALLGGATSAFGQAKKVVGFAQVGAESAWRTANTKSMQDEAKKRGYDLKFSDAQQKPENQIAAVRNFISQNVDVIVIAPIVETGWESVLRDAKDAGIPVVMSDRRAVVPEDYYVTFIGSDFVEEGRRAGRWLATKMQDKANIFQLEGTMGSAPQIDRKKGFEEVLKDKPNMKVIKSQTGEFTRAKGKSVMEAFLNSPEGKQCNVLFAHNDDMALGAIQAIEEAGKKPGTDIVIVSIDGIKDAFQAMVDGKLNCTVECNPLLGPQIFDAIDNIFKKVAMPKRIPSKEGVFDQTQAKEALPTRVY